MNASDTIEFFDVSGTEAAKIMRQVCDAVAHLHSMNIAHRDLKVAILKLRRNCMNFLVNIVLL